VHPINGIVGQPEEGVWIGMFGGTDEGRKCAFGVMWKGLRVWEMVVWGRGRLGSVFRVLWIVELCWGGRGVFM
jgi:hypothetical protein